MLVCGDVLMAIRAGLLDKALWFPGYVAPLTSMPACRALCGKRNAFNYIPKTHVISLAIKLIRQVALFVHTELSGELPFP